jgi:hypothetical protein
MPVNPYAGNYLYSMKSQLQKSFCVIPAKAGIQSFHCILDPGFRRGDGISWFCNWLNE